MDVIFCRVPVDIIEIVVNFSDCDTYYILRDMGYEFSQKLCDSKFESRVLDVFSVRSRYQIGSYKYKKGLRYYAHRGYDRPYTFGGYDIVWRKKGERHRNDDLPNAVSYLGTREWAENLQLHISYIRRHNNLPSHIDILYGECVWERGTRFPYKSRTSI